MPLIIAILARFSFWVKNTCFHQDRDPALGVGAGDVGFWVVTDHIEVRDVDPLTLGSRLHQSLDEVVIKYDWLSVRFDFNLVTERLLKDGLKHDRLDCGAKTGFRVRGRVIQVRVKRDDSDVLGVFGCTLWPSQTAVLR